MLNAPLNLKKSHWHLLPSPYIGRDGMFGVVLYKLSNTEITSPKKVRLMVP